MNKKQRYIDYVANDMVKDTRHYPNNNPEVRKGLIALYFPSEPSLETSHTVQSLGQYVGNSFGVMASDKEYLIGKYGSPDDMIQDIYDIYWERLLGVLLSKYS